MRKLALIFSFLMTSSLAFSASLECSLTDNDQFIRSQSEEIKNEGQTDMYFGEYDKYSLMSIYSEELIWILAFSQDKSMNSFISKNNSEVLTLEGQNGNKIELKCQVIP